MYGGSPAVNPHRSTFVQVLDLTVNSRTSTVLTTHFQEFKGSDIFTHVPPSCLPAKCCGLHVGKALSRGPVLSVGRLFSNLKKACWCSGMPSVICSSADRALWSEPEPITQQGGGGVKAQASVEHATNVYDYSDSRGNHTRCCSVVCFFSPPNLFIL